MARWTAWVRARAENLLALMMAVMFASFIAQVVARYALNLPLGFTEELCVLMWLWGILVGTSLVLGDRDEIRLDLLAAHAPPGVRRAMTVVGALALVALLVLAVPATLAYLAFMARERSPALGLRMDLVFAPFALLLVALIVRYARLAWLALVGRGDA